MTRNYSLPPINFREPKTLVRAGLGVLLLANLVAAVFAFHLIGDSPADLDARLTAAQTGFRAAQQHLNKSKTLIRNMELSRDQGGRFLASYMTSRRHTYSALGSELNKLAETSGMKVGDISYTILDPIEGSGDLETLTISANFEGNYAQLVKLVNLLDRSPRFLLIDSLQAAPQPKGDILNVTIKMNAFVKDDENAQEAAQ
jgi:type IV pilus assembly protein PilO